jgi:hypothetical protein
MNFQMKKNFAAAIGAGVFVTLIALPQARGELVYEDQQPVQNPAARTDDREQLRQVLSTSEKAQNTVQAQALQQQPPTQVYTQVQQAAPVTAPVYVQQPVQRQAVVVAAPAPVYVQPVVQRPVYQTAYSQAQPVQQVQAVQVPSPVLNQTLTAQPLPSDGTSASAAGTPAANGDTPNLSKTEMMRRERVREELKNEDSLEERLEELRLRDEQRRTNQILGVQGQDPTGAATAPVLAPANGVGMQNEAVVAPVTDHPGEMLQAPALPAQAQPVQAAQQPVQMVQPIIGQTVTGQPIYGAPVPAQRTDQLTTSSAMAVSQTTAPVDSGNPSDKTPVSISARAGVAGMSSVNGFDIRPSAAVGIEGGVGVTDNVDLVLGYQYSSFGIAVTNYYGNYSNPVTNNMNQNLFEGGVKIHVLGPDSKIRPFIAGGAGYSHSYINYDQAYLNMVGAGGLNSPDYEVSQWLGYVGGGLDFRLSKSIALGVDFRYYDVLSSSQNSSLNPYGFANYGSGINQSIGSSLASQSFYTAGAALTFTF